MHDTESSSSRRLGASGLLAEIRPDEFVPGAFQLTVDGVPQSHVNVADPTALFFEYIRRMGHAIDLVRAPGKPITALHLGGGALTLPRYVEATRPGSRQQVIELEPELIELVRARLPLPRGASIRVRYGDARDVLGRLPHGFEHAADVITADIYSGSATPRHVTTVEFYRAVDRFLASDGVVVVNVATADLDAVRRQSATIRAVFSHAIVTGDSQVVKGKRGGNVVVFAAHRPFAANWATTLSSRGPHPATVLASDALVRFEAGAKPTTDAPGASTASTKPQPR